MKLPLPSQAAAAFIVLALVLGGVAAGEVLVWGEAQIDPVSGTMPIVGYRRTAVAEAIYFNVPSFPGLIVRAPTTGFLAGASFYAVPGGGMEELVNGTTPGQVFYHLGADDPRPRYVEFAHPTVPPPSGAQIRRDGQGISWASIDFVWVQPLPREEGARDLADPFAQNVVRHNILTRVQEFYPHRYEQVGYFRPVEIALGLALAGTAIVWVAAVRRRRATATGGEVVEGPSDILIRLTERGEGYLRSLRTVMATGVGLLLVVASLSLFSTFHTLSHWASEGRVPDAGWAPGVLAFMGIALVAPLAAAVTYLVVLQRELKRWRREVSRPALPG